MDNVRTNHNFVVVELQENVWVRTEIPKDSHAALRAGFVGYPANPRWNVSKFCAWKTGRHWREALTQGTMVVRSSDLMLVPVTQKDFSSNKAKPKNQRFRLPFSKQLATSSH